MGTGNTKVCIAILSHACSDLSSSIRPQDYKELFNYRHAQLRNVIERIFSVMKKRFKVLTIPQEYDLEMQAQIMCALAVVHNFMKIHDPGDQSFKDDDMVFDSDGDNSITTWPGSVGSKRESARAAAHRETITHAMWEDYQSKKART